jgi:hypothetical protein
MGVIAALTIKDHTYHRCSFAPSLRWHSATVQPNVSAPGRCDKASVNDQDC